MAKDYKPMNYLIPETEAQRRETHAFLLGVVNGCVFGAMIAMVLMLPYLR